MPIPTSDIDPYSHAYFENPLPAQEALREAGPVVRLQRYGVLGGGALRAGARHAERLAELLVGARRRACPISPRKSPGGCRAWCWRPTRRCMTARARCWTVCCRRPRCARLRAGFAGSGRRADRRTAGARQFDAVPDLAEAYPLSVFPDAVGMPRENRRFLLPYGNMVFNSFGPRNALFEDAVADAEPVIAWVQAQSQRDALAPVGFGAAIHAAADAGGSPPRKRRSWCARC